MVATTDGVGEPGANATLQVAAAHEKRTSAGDTTRSEIDSGVDIAEKVPTMGGKQTTSRQEQEINNQMKWSPGN